MQAGRLQSWWSRWRRLEGDDPRRSFLLTRSIFLRGLGIVYLVAFVSLWVQVDGLIGSRGILPANQFLSQARLELGDVSPLGRFWDLPTLCWISSSDVFLHFLCAAGTVLALILIIGLIPVPALALLWLLYLSLANVGQIFLGYQWDALLLETGFLAIFLAPLSLRLRPALRWGRKAARPLTTEVDPSAAKPGEPEAVWSHSAPRLALVLIWWLLFRLMFLSGLVKLTSGDANWRGLTALRYHYWTQPLPTWTSWYMNLAPNWFGAMSVLGVLFTELLVPVLIFTPRRMRLAGCGLLVLLQLLIAGTGNYGFFNLLAIVLCLALVDDATWNRAGFRAGLKPHRAANREWPVWITAPVALFLIPLSFVPALRHQGLADWLPSPLVATWRSVQQFESVNAYGLFAIMTTRRLELVIEGSDDGTQWHTYEFKYKPGDVYRRPRFCAPHMPRLDWQMWFAGVDVEQADTLDQWVLPFLQRLGEGSPPVLKLLRTNPFPDHPPRMLRVVIYDYRFTTGADRSRTGAWWQRQRVATTPVIPVANEP